MKERIWLISIVDDTTAFLETWRLSDCSWPAAIEATFNQPDAGPTLARLSPALPKLSCEDFICAFEGQ
jgi:hypothetical protein